MIRSRRLIPAAGAVAVLAASIGAVAAPAAAPSSGVRVRHVGTVGNEPLIAVAPDGTIYISALQYMYRSTDHGAHWTSITLPPESGYTEYKTDSSISVDPGGRLYYVFDYPYAGTTAVCTSDDRGNTWACNPAALPGGTDRMWITAPTKSEAFFTSNEGTEQPIFAYSNDRGATWHIGEMAGTGTNAYTGQPIAGATGSVLSPVNASGKVQVDIYPRDGGTAGDKSPAVSTGLPSAFTGPSGGRTPDGRTYVASEAPNQSHGRGVVVARSSDQGRHWRQLPALPGSGSGTAIFTALAAGANGHVGILFYWSPTSANPESMPTSAKWYAVYVDSFDANTARPHWRRTVLHRIQHTGTICRGLGCDLDGSPPHHTNYRFAGDFVGATIGRDGYAYVTWMGADKPPVATPLDPSSTYGVIDFARVAPPRR